MEQEEQGRRILVLQQKMLNVHILCAGTSPNLIRMTCVPAVLWVVLTCDLTATMLIPSPFFAIYCRPTEKFAPLGVYQPLVFAFAGSFIC